MRDTILFGDCRQTLKEFDEKQELTTVLEIMVEKINKLDRSKLLMNLLTS